MAIPGGVHLAHKLIESVTFESMQLTTVIALFLKLAAILIGTVVGAIGLSKESVDPKTKRLTKWGRVALTAVICSGVVALASQGVESYLASRSEKHLLSDIEAELQNQQNTLRSQRVLLTNINRGLYPFSVDTTVNCRFEIPLNQPSINAQYASAVRLAADRQNGVVPLDPNDPLCPAALASGRTLATSLQQVMLDVFIRKDRDFDPRQDQVDVAFRISPEWNKVTAPPSTTSGPVTRPIARAFYTRKRDAIILEASNWPPDWITHDPAFASFLDFKGAFVCARVTSNGYGVNVNVDRVGLADRTGRAMFMNDFRVFDGRAGMAKMRLPDQDSALWIPKN
jgi:hypothetical protein